MATIKLSALAAIAAASISATDILPMTDSDAGTPTTYKVSMAQMRTAILQASVGTGWGATDYLGLGAGTVPSTGMVRVGQGAITADTPLINSTATWNNAAISFRHLLVNVTDTASNAASLFADFQIGGASKWSVTKAGAVTQAAGLTVTAGGLTVSAGTTAVQALTVAGASIFATSMRFDGNAVKFRFHNSGFEDWDVGTLTSSTSFSIGSATLADVLTIGNAGGASLKGALTVTSGGIGVTGASTITGTLGGITTLTVNTLATTTSTAITFNNNGNNDVWLNAAGASFRILSNGGAGQLLSVSQAGVLTLSATLTMSASASRLVPGATSFSHRNNADSADNLLISDAGEVSIRSRSSIGAGLLAAGVMLNMTGTHASALTGSWGAVIAPTMPAIVTTAIPLQLQLILAGSGVTATSGYGLLVKAPSFGSSTVTTTYGLYIEAQAATTTAWSIFCENGGVTFRNSALSTVATTGHLFIPSCAGAPVGTPASIPTGQVALQYDSTNNQLYVYNGAWKKTIALT